MAPPSKTFTIITDAEIDPDSPLTTGLMNSYRNNDIHLEEWLGLDFTAAQNHNHDGVNSAAVTVTAAALSTALFNLSTSSTTAVSTGALAFTPVMVFVVGHVKVSTIVYGFSGFAVGTGTSARSLAWEFSSGTAVSVDADAIGGEALSTGGTTHSRDLDVTNFTKAAPGIEFTPNITGGTWIFKVLVFGAT